MEQKQLCLTWSPGIPSKTVSDQLDFIADQHTAHSVTPQVHRIITFLEGKQKSKAKHLKYAPVQLQLGLCSVRT